MTSSAVTLAPSVLPSGSTTLNQEPSRYMAASPLRKYRGASVLAMEAVSAGNAPASYSTFSSPKPLTQDSGISASLFGLTFMAFAPPTAMIR